MAKQPFNLPNGRAWSSRKEAIEHFSRMLARYVVGESIALDADHDDLLALLQHYDRDVPTGGKTKIGAGVERFEKGQNRGDGFTTSCFIVRRVDSSCDDFSFIKAIRS